MGCWKIQSDGNDKLYYVRLDQLPFDCKAGHGCQEPTIFWHSLCCNVRGLANRYRIAGPVNLAETHLHHMLSPSTALMLFIRIVDNDEELADIQAN